MQRNEKIARLVKSWGIGFFLIKNWRSILTKCSFYFFIFLFFYFFFLSFILKGKFVCKEKNVDFLVNISKQKEILFSTLIKNVKKTYEWEYDENSWQIEKEWIKDNEWISQQISSIKSQIQPCIVLKLVKFQKKNPEDSEKIAKHIVSSFEETF